MHFKKVIAICTLTASVLTSSVFAFAESSAIRNDEISIQHQINERKGMSYKFEKHGAKKRKHFEEEVAKDPIKALEMKKEKVDSLLKEGKITKEKADEIKRILNQKIKEIEEFNKLPIEQKREQLISRFREMLDRKVKEGRLTQEEAGKLMKQFEKEIKNYDGKGYPGFFGKHHRLKLYNNEDRTK